MSKTMIQRHEFICQAEGRLDTFLADNFDVTRSKILNYIKNEQVMVNGVIITKAGYKLNCGNKVLMDILEVKQTELVAQDIKLDIIFQDSDIVVINKPQGMVVHPAAGNWDKTLVNALMFAIKDLAGIGGEMRPGIVHRIDKNTSGLLVVAKNDDAHADLSLQLKNRTMGRTYYAIAEGVIKQENGIIDAPIGRSHKDRKKMAVVPEGRNAVTKFEVLATNNGHSLVKLELETGRTHQIRVHLAHIGHPVTGDVIYGSRDKLKLNAQALHAKKLHLIHPKTRQELCFEAHFPDSFKNAMLKLGLEFKS